MARAKEAPSRARWGVVVVAVVLVVGVGVLFELAGPGRGPVAGPRSATGGTSRAAGEVSVPSAGSGSGRWASGPGDGPEELAARKADSISTDGEARLTGTIVIRDSVVEPPFDVILVTGPKGRERVPADEEGEFAFQDVRPGEWSVEVHAARPESTRLMGPAPRTKDALAVQHGTIAPGEHLRIEIALGWLPEDSCHVFGVLVGELSTQVDYRVALHVPGDVGLDRTVDASGDGVFDLGQAPPGPGTLNVYGRPPGASRDHFLTNRFNDLEAAQEQFLEVEVPRASFVFLRAVDGADGRAVPEARVHFESVDLEGFGGADYRPGEEPRLLPEGEYLVVATAPGYSLAFAAFDAGGPEVMLDVPLSLTRAESHPTRLVDESGAPIAGAMILVRELHGRQLSLGLSPTARTDEDGVLDVAFLPPGVYRAEFFLEPEHVRFEAELDLSARVETVVVRRPGPTKTE